MLDLLRTAQARRVMVLVTLLAGVVALVCMVATNYFIESEWKSTLLQSAGQVAVGAVGAILTAAYLLFLSKYLLKIEGRIDELTFLTARDGHAEIVKSMSDSTTWRHDGQLGKWVRKAVFSEYRNLAKIDSIGRTIGLIILDPENDKLLSEFIEYHALSRGLTSTSGLDLDMKAEIMSTIVWSGVVEQHFLGVSVDLTLRKEISFVRTDLGDRKCFDTLPGRHTPIIAMNSNGPHCDYFIAANRRYAAAKTQGRTLDLHASRLSMPPTAQEAAAFFRANKIVSCDDSLIAECLKRSGPGGGTRYD